MGNDIRLETQRLVLREFSAGDWKGVHEYASDPEAVQYLEWGPNTEAESRAHQERVEMERKADPRGQYSLAVTLKDGGTLIGGGRIGVGSFEHRRADIGYVLNRKFWGKGYGTEVGQALVRFGFETLKMHRVGATCHPDNKASQRVLEKAGMRYEGRLRENKKVRGKWRDSLVFSVLEQEWKKIAAGKDFFRPVDE